MSDDDSNDVVMVESNDEGSRAGEGSSTDSETRPLMQLFQRLISNDNKQNTVLTNAQIISILHTEFEIDITMLHELEVDIYLNVVKRFLKDWPKWDEFDQGINILRKKNAYKSIKKTLEAKYIDLKDFLKIQLIESKPLAQQAISKMIADNAKKMEKVNTSEITLEVYCTRKQLNKLILNQPLSSDVENTIFNLTDFIPSSITVNKLPIASILNWFSVKVTVEIHGLYFQRWTNHQLKHVLVNSKNGLTCSKRKLKTKIQMKDVQRMSDELDTNEYFPKLCYMLQNEYMASDSTQCVLISLIEVIKSDLQFMDTIKVPAMYRQYSNKYPYCRKLKKDVDASVTSVSYDLYLEETLSPMHMFQTLKNPKSLSSCVTIECMECKIKFVGNGMYNKLREHFDVYHSNEPDWNCTNCNQLFTMAELTVNKWHHICCSDDSSVVSAVGSHAEGRGIKPQQ